MSCNLFIDETNVTKKLKESFGSNETLYTSYITDIMDRDGVSEDFKRKLKEKTNIDFDNISDKDVDTVVDYIKEYYNSLHPDINNTTEDDYIVYTTNFGYSSTNARELGKRISANFMLKAYSMLLNDKHTSIKKRLKEESKRAGRTISKKEFFANIVSAYIKQEIISSLESRGLANRKSIMQLFKDNNTLAIEQLFGKNATIQDQNLMAIYKEIKGNRTGFFNEVFRDSRLGDLRFDKEDSVEDADYDAIEGQEGEPNSTNNTIDGNSPTNDKGSKVDHSTEKFGDYINFMTHVGMNIRSYLGNITKLHSGNKIDGKYDLNTDNELGIADTMSAEECCSALYGYGNYINIDTMIQSIRDIANTVPGFAGFHQMADYLNEHRDFAFDIYRTFGKLVVSKLETISKGDEQTSRISNYSADKLTSLKFEFFNAIKSTAIYNRDENSSEIYQKIDTLINNINTKLEDLNKITGTSKQDIQDREDINNEINNHKQELISALIRNLRKYYPTISDYTISNYLSNGNDGNIVDNAKRLNTILKNTIDSSSKTFQDYNSRQAEIGKLYREKKEIEDNAKDRRLTRNEKQKIEELNNKITKLYGQEYTSKGNRDAAFELAKELVNYSKIKTELNSRNVHGNQSSDVINNSFISNLMQTLKSNRALNNYGKYKTQSRQYDFSNIMIEHKDKDGSIINYGLFTQDPQTKELTPTSYAHQLLQVRLFNGASNLDTANNILYAEMSKGDYTATSFINFFNSDTTYDENDENIAFANYFMRIPSDAPKNYIIRAPRYSTRGLVKKDANGNTIIDVNHRIFKQFKNIFIQELTDAATALSTFFNNKNGYIYLNDKQGKDYLLPRFKDGYDNSETTARTLYAGYHVGKSKTLLVKNEKTGEYELTGSVFKSDRFTVTKVATEDIEVNGVKYKKGDVYVENYGNAILNEAFNLLYGGANDTYIHTTTNDKGVNAYLTPAQEEVVNKHLSRFILDYVEQAKTRMAQYKNFIPEKLYNSTNIAEYVLNHHLMYAGFNDLFEGDTKFYKDTQTFLKRAKEAQASGVPYGIVDYDMDLTSYRTRINSTLNDKRFSITKEDGTKEVLDKYEYEKAIQRGCTVEEATDIANTIEQTNKFRGVTIKNTINTGETVGIFKRDKKGNIITDKNGVPQFEKKGALTEKLINVFRTVNKMTKEEAEAKAAKMMAGYADTTVNDAQSYITFEEWVRRVSARGQLEQYMPLIEAVLDESKPIDASVIEQFIQVQKNFYYDQHYNARLGTMAPRQIKNAEFVLVPRLIRGTQLEQVYDLMKKNGIDQLNTEETSKAGKCNVLTLWDNNGELTEKNIKDFNDNATKSIELYNYNYLYTQQETPQHINAQNKAGIQIMKKIVDNIPSDSPLYDLKERFFNLYSANVKESFNNLMDEFDLETDENGNLVLETNERGEKVIKGLNYEIFYQRLQEEVARLGLDSNMIDYVTLDKDGIPIMPSYISNISSKFESIAQSLFNSRITRQKLPGFHAAQITNVGWNPINQQVKGRSYSKKLRYHPDGKPYVEIMLPKSNFNLKLTNPDGSLKSDKELLEELQSEGLDTMIGYRIPTEGKQSVCVMKVVGFTDDALGSTIVVPDDWVSQTGSDFDIDSVYGINYTSEIDNETSKIKKIEYKEDKPTRDGRNNEILNTMIKILSSDLSLEENLSRSNFDGIKDAKKEMTTAHEAAIRNGRSTYNILDQIDYQEDVMSGAKLKAFSVTRDTFCSICNTVQPKIADNNTIKIVYKADIKEDDTAEIIKKKNKELKKRLTKSFENVEEIADGTFVVTHNTFGWSKNNKNVLGELITTYSSQTTAHILDAVKEGTVKNVNDYTFQVYKTFPDIGSDYSTAIGFMMQPGVTTIVNAYNSNKSIYTDERSNPIKTAFKEIGKKILIANGIKVTNNMSFNDISSDLQKFNIDLARLFGAAKNNFKIGLNDEEATKLLISKDRLKARLEEKDIFNSSTPVGRQNQLLFDLGVVMQFSKLYNFSNTISSYTRIFNPDKFGAKQTIFSTNKVFRDINEVLKKDRDNPVLTVNNESIVKAVYPDIERGIDAFITSPSSNSAYPPLYNFLKYATATSIKVNRALFATQSPEFVDEVMKLENDFSGNTRMTEDTYKNFQNYILNHFYNNTDVVSQSCTYVLGKGIIFRAESDKFEERARIYGYNYTPDFKVPSLKPISIETKNIISLAESVSTDGITKQYGVVIDSNLKQNYSTWQINNPNGIVAYRVNFNNYNSAEEANSGRIGNPFSENTRGKDTVNQFFIWLVTGENFGNTKATEEYRKAIINKILNTPKNTNILYYKELNRPSHATVIGYLINHKELLDTESQVYDNIVDFKVEDINNPTQRELNQFATLSPAQKVEWIQNTFRETGVFKYLRTSLFNSSNTNRVGMQTIQFIEGNENIETVYSEFKKCYYNKNPFVKLATLDLIKYAFAVEGFKMRKNAVNKIITNDVLYKEAKDGGTGIISQLNYAIKNIVDGTINIDEIRENYIRSHSSMNEIESHYVKKVEKDINGKKIKVPELDVNSDGIILVEDLKLAEKYGLIYNVNGYNYNINNYVKLNFGEVTTLYKIEDIAQGSMVLYPLNTLEENEDSTFSINNSNNKYLEKEYYENIINDYKNSYYNTEEITTLQSIIESHSENRNEYKAPIRKNISQNYAKSFNINDKNTVYTGGFEKAIQTINDYFSTNPFGNLYLRSGAIANFIKHTGAVNGSIQKINNRYYLIQKSDFSDKNKKYIEKGQPVKESNPQIQEIMEKAQETGYKVNDVFYVSPHNTNVRFSSIEEESIHESTAVELGVKSMKVMASHKSSEGDIDAQKSLNYFNNKDIVATDASVSQNLNDVIRITAEYVQNATEEIMDNLNHFITDANGITHSVIEPEVIDLIRTSPSARQRFLKTILNARAFVRQFSLINELDITSESDEIKPFLNKIKECIDNLRNATIISRAERTFANDVLAKLSDNLRVQDGTISLLDGYHSTGAFDAWVNDLQETANPLLQIVTKEVMGNIRAAELKSHKDVKIFKDSLAALKEKAKKAGVNIDWKHIIDDYGKFVQDYNQAFIDRLTELRENRDKAKIINGEGSEEYLRAKLEYDKWKVKYTNQMLDDDYYKRRIAIEEHMLGDGTEENKGYTTIFVAYKKLDVKRRDLLSHARNGILEEHYQEELKKVNQEIDNLVGDYFYNQATGEFEKKYGYENPLNPISDETTKTLYSLESAKALQGYLKSMKALREDYFDEDAKFGFEKQLEENLDIVNNYEMRVNGEITTPIAELMKHDDYVKAKTWLENNARYVVNETIQVELNDAYKVLNEKSENRRLLKAIAKKKEAYDSHGTIDATKFIDEEIEQIRKEQLASFNIREEQPFTDRTLITNAPTDDTIFSAEFYKGMTLNGAKNQDYIAKVNEINAILSKHYSTFDKTLHTSEFTEQEIEELIKLYDELDLIKKVTKSTNSREVAAFMQNVEFVYDEVKYEQERDFASQKGDRYFELWKKLNESINEEGIIVPNRYLYGYARPKGYKPDGTGNNTFVDAAKTKALRTIRNRTRTTKTQYYFSKYKEMKAKSKAEFDAWYEANHIYNPYNHTVEPLQCWTKLEINQDNKVNQQEEIGLWIPNYNQTDIVPKSDKLNKHYKVGQTTASNYKRGFSEYDNIGINDIERDIKDLFENTLRQFAKTNQANKFLDKGYMVSRVKSPEVDSKFIAKETAKLIGWINNSSGKETWYSDEEIDYSKDTTIDMPMTSILKSKDSIEVPRIAPRRQENESLEDFNKRLDEFNKEKKKAEEHNAKVHKDLLDNNWESVMEEFIQKAARFNAIQENKYMLFYAKEMIDKLDVYIKNVGFNDLQTTGKKTDDGKDIYATKKDTRLQEQYINWIRRLVYDQWKRPNNKLTRAANIMQSLTSAKFMMLNVTGGIANISVGTFGIIGETLAKEYLGSKTWAKGMNTWRSGLPSFLADMYKDEASTLASAIVKMMNVVDFDENTGSVHVPNASEYVKRVRDIAFSPQAMGEHMMQNGVMFSLMHSHRLVQNMDKNGRLSYEYKNLTEYTRDAEEKALLEVIEDNNELKEKYEKFKKDEKKDVNNVKEYAWFRKEYANQFVNIYFSDELKRKFRKIKESYINKAKKEFEDDAKHPTLFSQLKLGDNGKLAFKDDSILSSMGDEAYQLLGRFKGRVISVNKKIHGVYDRLGAAKWESYWWGGLVMQYHKHIYPGIMKRYRRQGYFNEERGTIEKGCYASIKDFLALPLQKANYMKKLKAENEMTESEVITLQGIQNIVKSYIDFALHAKLHYKTMSEYDKANMRRAMADLLCVASAICTAIALRIIAGGDDDKQGLIYNLFMYEADRLASESFMYNPFGLISEGKKLWSSPVAFTNSLEDGLASFGLIAQYIIQGDEFDPYYSSGLYAGENKFEIMLKRNIPVYHSIYMLQRLERNNKYYKLGDNMLSIIPTKDIAEWFYK